MKISVAVGFTLRLAKNSNEFIRPEIRFQDIDLDQNIDQQLSEASKAFIKAWDEIDNCLDQKVWEILDNQEKPHELISKAFKEINSRLDNVEELIKDFQIKKVKK